MTKKLLSLITTLAVCIALLNGLQVSAYDKNETVLFEGNAYSQFTSWSDWNSAVSLGTSQFDVNAFDKPFTIEVEYTSEEPPILVLQSWSGGTSWADMTPSYISNGTACYLFDKMCDYYGTDFTKLNSIKVMPDESDLWVTRVSFRYEEDIPEIKCNGIAGKISEEINAGWNLGNTFDSYGDWIIQYTDRTTSDFETAWNNPVTTKKMIEDVRSAGFNAVRLPVTWKQHIDSNGQIEEQWMNRVEEVVGYILDSGMYCILNVHHDTGENGWLKATPDCVQQNSQRFAYLWGQIASRFACYDTRLVFEGFNEILDDANNWNYGGAEATASVNRFNQIFVNTVRATGGHNSERCLVVNTYAADFYGNNLDEFIIPEDSAQDAIIAEVHYYRPYKYCTEDYPEYDSWMDEDGKNGIDGTLFNLYQHFTSKGVPVIIGEFGVPNKSNDADRCEYADYLVNKAKDYGIKCFYWDAGGVLATKSGYDDYTGMSLYDRHHLCWAFPELAKSITGKYCSPLSEHIIGDVDMNGKVDIMDATYMQMHLADYPSVNLTAEQLTLSDTDKDYSTSIKDVTNIQLYIVQLLSSDNRTGTAILL